MPTFPSVQWFEAVRELVNNDAAFRQLGTIDARVGVKVGDQLFEITFEAFECTAVQEIAESMLPELDFLLEQSPEEWKDLIENTKEHGGADLKHTLNTIDLTRPEGFALSHDGYRRDTFYRFNQSLQHFFDTSSKIETDFAVSANAG